MNKKKWIPILEILVVTIIYWWYTYPDLEGAGDYVFINPFNLKDGSIYWVLNIYLIIGYLLFFGNIYYAIPRYLKKRKAKQYIVSIVVIFIGVLGLEEVLNQVVLISYMDTLYNRSKIPTLF